MLTITEGKFRMLRPVRSSKGYYIVGAIVGSDNGLTYTKNVQYAKEIPKATDEIRKKVLRDHPGIIEETQLTRVH